VQVTAGVAVPALHARTSVHIGNGHGYRLHPLATVACQTLVLRHAEVGCVAVVTAHGIGGSCGPDRGRWWPRGTLCSPWTRRAHQSASRTRRARCRTSSFSRPGGGVQAGGEVGLGPRRRGRAIRRVRPRPGLSPSPPFPLSVPAECSRGTEGVAGGHGACFVCSLDPQDLPGCTPGSAGDGSRT
jgi:hypothetical protein